MTAVEDRVARSEPVESVIRWAVFAPVTIAVLGAMVLPSSALLAYTADVDAAIGRAVDIPGVEVVDIDRTWLPLDPGTELASLEVVPADRASSDVATVLVDAGFEESSHLADQGHGLYHRENGGGGLGWRDTDEITITERPAAGPAGESSWTLDLRMPNAHSGDFLPLTVLASSLLVGLAAVALTGVSRVAGSWLGGVGLALTGFQGALAVRAMVRASALLDEYRSTVGPLDREQLWVTPQPPTLLELRRGVEAVASHLYPVAAGALLLLAVPWLVSSAAVFLRRPRALVASAAAWIAAAVVMVVVFRADSGIVLDILE